MAQVESLKKEPKPLAVYNGFEIRMNSTYRFEVTDARDVAEKRDDFSGYGYDSMAQAKEVIDKAIADEEKASRTSWKTFHVLNEHGITLQVRGIHKSRGHLLTTPPTEDRATFYPAKPGVRALLAEQKQLLARLKRIQNALQPYRLDSRMGYGRSSVDLMQNQYEKFEQELREAEALPDLGTVD